MEEQDIPIDIYVSKLLDWLITRRHVNRDWQTKVLPIREKINNAIQDMPVHEGIAKLLSGSYINYYHCKKIVEILRETEASSKNFFGSYGSKRMKDWLEVVKLYENDNVYLGEVAQMLTRNVNYEIPGLRKQIAKLEQMIVDCDIKEASLQKRWQAAQNDIKSLCKELGIEGHKVKHELIARLKELPEIYDKVAENAKLLTPAVEYYSAFVIFVVGREHPGGCVPMLKYLIEHGNTTTYEWTYGEKPVQILEPPLLIDLEDEVDENEKNGDENVGIDFGDENVGVDFGDDIDFGNVELDESGDIDWGNSDFNSTDNQEIDFNVGNDESGIVVESSGIEGGIAKDEYAYSLLDNPNTRNTIITELMELQAFLKMRLFDMKEANNLISLSQFQNADSFIQLQTAESVLSMLNTVQVTLANLTSTSAKYLNNIKHSPQFVKNMARIIPQKQIAMSRYKENQVSVREKRAQLQEQIKLIQPQIPLIIEKTKELKLEIEGDISKRYKNRPVNIMGAVGIF